MGKANNEMRDKKGKGDDVPEDVLEMLGEDGLRVVTQLISNVHETGQRHKGFTGVTVNEKVKNR
jgi:hypothetical protein